MIKSKLAWGYEDDGPNCLIGSHGTLFVRVAHTPQHNAVEYARKFAAVDELIEALEFVRDYGGKGEVCGGEHAGASVSFFVEEALAKAQGT